MLQGVRTQATRPLFGFARVKSIDDNAYMRGQLCFAPRRRYYNDLWLFDTEELRWEQVARPGVSPAPRGGCQVRVRARVRERVRVLIEARVRITEELRWLQVARPGAASAPHGGCQVRRAASLEGLGTDVGFGSRPGRAAGVFRRRGAAARCGLGYMQGRGESAG